MAEITRLPIRRAGEFALQDERCLATVGGVRVVVARFATVTDPMTWGIFLRAEGQPDALVCTAEWDGEQDFASFGLGVGQFASVVEKTLRLAQERPDALLSGAAPHGGAA